MRVNDLQEIMHHQAAAGVPVNMFKLHKFFKQSKKAYFLVIRSRLNGSVFDGEKLMYEAHNLAMSEDVVLTRHSQRRFTLGKHVGWGLDRMPYLSSFLSDLRSVPHFNNFEVDVVVCYDKKTSGIPFLSYNNTGKIFGFFCGPPSMISFRALRRGPSAR